MGEVIRVRKKGVLIIPKKIREEAGIQEGDEIVLEAKKGELLIRALKPKVVDVDPKIIDELLREENNLER